MAMDLLGVAGWTVENKTFYEKKLLLRAVPNFVYTGWGIQKPIPTNIGNSIEWRRLNRPSASTTALTEGTPPSVTNTTWTSVVATVAQYGAYQQLSDVAMRQSIDNVLSESVDMYGEHMADSIDRVARAILVAGTNVQYANAATSRGALTVGNILTSTEIRKAVMNLKRRDARPIARTASNMQPGSPSGDYGTSGPKYVLITHPDATSDLLNDTNIINALQYAGVRGGDNPLFTGQMFDWLGCRILETSNCAFVSGAGLSLAAAVHVCQTIVFGEGFYGETEFTQDAMEIKVKPIGSAGALDPLDQFGTVGWKAAKAFVVLNQSFGQRIEHANTNNSMPVNP